MAWTLTMAEEDTGWVPVPEGGQTHPIFPLDPASGGVIGEVQPGRNRVLVFVDVDGDSTFSGVPDTLLAFVPDSLRTTLPDSVSSADWFLEPWLMVEEIFIEPGLDSELNLPALPYNLTPWTQPEPAAILPDSLLESGTDGADLGDGAEAADDSLTVTGEKE